MSVMQGYEQKIEMTMKAFFDSLSEKDKRRYAAVEVKKLEYGGTDYISALFNIDQKTIRRGLSDLEDSQELELKGIRKKGAGQKQK